MSTLIINATPNRSKESVSNQLLAIVRKQLGESATYLDLYDEDIPPLDGALFQIYDKLKTAQPLSVEEEAIQQRRQELLDLFLASQNVIILYPLYNFNVPSKLKDFMDTILVPRKTFYYTEDGQMNPLLEGQDRSVLFIQVSGSIYSDNPIWQEMEFAYHYLDTMFAKIGVGSRQLIRLEGTALLDKETLLAQAQKDVAEWQDCLYREKE